MKFENVKCKHNKTNHFSPLKSNGQSLVRVHQNHLIVVLFFFPHQHSVLLGWAMMETSNVVRGQELDNSPKYLMVKSDQLEGRVTKVEETMQGMVKEIQQMKAAFHRFAKMVSCYMYIPSLASLLTGCQKVAHLYDS